MEEKAYIEVRIEGTIHGQKLSLMDVDISEIKEIISEIETFLYPTRIEKKDRPLISYKIEDGSARHLFFLPVTGAILFNGLISEIDNRNSIDFLEYKRLLVIDRFQRKAKENDYEITLSSSLSNTGRLKLTKDTNYLNVAAEFIETEFYLYGEVYLEGGISPNFHVSTKEYGKLIVSATKAQLAEGENKLYKIYGIKAFGKQNLSDGRPSDLVLGHFLEYNPTFDKSELDLLISKATPNLSKIKDVDEWLYQIRGGVYE